MWLSGITDTTALTEESLPKIPKLSAITYNAMSSLTFKPNGHCSLTLYNYHTYTDFNMITFEQQAITPLLKLLYNQVTYFANIITFRLSPT